ncbi:hypothetical protein DFH11DRAFT_1514015 [Phellopilus nigrolimitatus]|nr:hypothetical protein DFH11DRAFT_1514015 [Phellopilus nigrolimitatus]
MSTSDLPTERTPLVDRTDIYQKLPYLLQIERSIYDGHGPGFTVSPTTITQSIAVYSAALPSEAAKTALTLLLYLRCLSGSYLEKASGDRSRLRISRLAECTVQAWKELDSEEAEVLHQILWMPFPIDEGNEGSQTVIEAILTPGCPLAVALDDRVASSLLKLWDHGQPSSAVDAPVSTLETLITRVSTPRIFHLMELVSYTAYLWIYAIYILDPPYHSIFEGQPSPDWRSYILTFYAASRILKDTWRPAIPFYCTVLAFATTLPSTPESGDFSYTLMLLSFFLHVIQSHMPLPPSPVMLMPRTFAVPLSAILHILLFKIIVPAFLFFLPACLISFFLCLYLFQTFSHGSKGQLLTPRQAMRESRF